VARPDQKSTAGMDPEELVRRRGAGAVPLDVAKDVSPTVQTRNSCLISLGLQRKEHQKEPAKPHGLAAISVDLRSPGQILGRDHLC